MKNITVLLVFQVLESVDEDYTDDEDDSPELEVPPNYTTKVFENKLFVICEATEEFTLLFCDENRWKSKYPATSSIFFFFVDFLSVETNFFATLRV